MMLNGTDLWPEGWEGEVSLGLIWLEVGELGGFCLKSASEVVVMDLAQHVKTPGVVGGAGFVCGSLRCLESLRASEQEEEEDCPESYPTMNPFCWGP